ncbi:MAG: beta-ketoacyl-ACP synthase III [Butyrivibrio sp.]
MKGIHILATGRALPKHVVTNDDMSRIVDTNDEWIRERTGIASRYKCGEEETCTTLAIEAAARALKKSGIDKNSVYAVIVATSTAETAFPSTACMIQKALGLPDEVMAFDMTAACTGFVYGLNVCRGLLMCNPGRRIILVGSEQISRIVDYTDRQSCILFGDGAGAAVIESSNDAFFHRAWSDGDAEMEALYCKGIGHDGAHLMMNGKKVFRFAVGAMQQGIDGVLEESGMNIGDIDYIVCHQANLRIIRNVMKKYDVPEEKFYINIEKYANTSAASIIIALDEMYEKGMLKPGMKVICVGFGAGLTWSSALFTI